MTAAPGRAVLLLLAALAVAAAACAALATALDTEAVAREPALPRV